MLAAWGSARGLWPSVVLLQFSPWEGNNPQWGIWGCSQAASPTPITVGVQPPHASQGLGADPCSLLVQGCVTEGGLTTLS